MGSRALRNTMLVLTAKVVARLVALVTVLAMIKYLKAAPYGAFATVVNYTAIVSVVLDLGFNVLFVREGARRPSEECTSRAGYFFLSPPLASAFGAAFASLLR